MACVFMHLRGGNLIFVLILLFKINGISRVTQLQKVRLCTNCAKLD